MVPSISKFANRNVNFLTMVNKLEDLANSTNFRSSIVSRHHIYRSESSNIKESALAVQCFDDK